MFEIAVVRGNSSILDLREEITALAGEIGDSRQFAGKYIGLANIMAVARENNKIIGFSLARNSISPFIRGVMFFATRILPEYQNRKLGGLLVKSLVKKSIKSRGLSLFKPFYLVTGTAHPVVYASFLRKMKTIPAYGKTNNPGGLSGQIAVTFAKIFCPEFEFDAANFIVKGAFRDSAELFESDKIPWAKDEKINRFLEDRLSLTKRQGNMLVIVSLIPKIWEIKQYLF